VTVCGALVTRSILATSAELWAGTRYALKETGRPKTVAAPWPIWHVDEYWGEPVRQVGLAVALESTPGASLTVMLEGVPALVSSCVVVVKVGSPPAGNEPVAEVTEID
jgi:hypothetical protein